jgi:ribonuclease D
VKHDTINSPEQLREFCQHLETAPVIGFDTEFVSEDTYWSELCLIQVATPDRLAVIDPYQAKDVTPFWEVLATGNHLTVCHAGREEVVFSTRAVNRPPANLFDIQIAAGLVGHEYPAGYGSLIFKLTGIRPPKGETRTDWRKRPLSDHQIEYALADVKYLLQVHQTLDARLQELGRTEWMQDEMAAWLQGIDESLNRPRWRRVSGISGLSRRSLAIVRELWHWREQEAQQRDRPARRVLRDDLLVEMAKRATADPKRIAAIRGMERSAVKRNIPDLARCIARALESGEDKIPPRMRTEMPSQLNLLGQFLTSALTSICRRAEVAASLVGTASDVRDLIAYRMGFGNAENGELPKLASGWRAEIVGSKIDQLLAGDLSIRIEDPLSDRPLAFEPPNPQPE